MTESSRIDTRSAPITERRFLLPFVLITTLFFLWAFGVNLNDILIPRFRTAFALNATIGIRRALASSCRMAVASW